MNKTVISSYPVSVVIGNYRWKPGRNQVTPQDEDKIHWPSVERDLRLQIVDERELVAS